MITNFITEYKKYDSRYNTLSIFNLSNDHNQIGGDPMEELYKEITANNFDRAIEIIESGKDINLNVRKDWYTPLSLAVSRMPESMDLVDKMLSAGADPNFPAHVGTDPETKKDILAYPLYLLLRGRGEVDILSLQTLLDYGADYKLINNLTPAQEKIVRDQLSLPRDTMQDMQPLADGDQMPLADVVKDMPEDKPTEGTGRSDNNRKTDQNVISSDYLNNLPL